MITDARRRPQLAGVSPDVEIVLVEDGPWTAESDEQMAPGRRA
ncbi:hypothetical protein [Aeromicrobium sp. UC242_57]